METYNYAHIDFMFLLHVCLLGIAGDAQYKSGKCSSSSNSDGEQQACPDHKSTWPQVSTHTVHAPDDGKNREMFLSPSSIFGVWSVHPVITNTLRALP